MPAGLQVLSDLKEVLVCKEKTYGTSQILTTATGAAADASHWLDTTLSTQLIDGATRDGSFLVGSLLIVASASTTAAIRGQARRITAYTHATTSFTLDTALAATPQATDTAYIVKPVRCKIGTAKINRTKLPREYHTSSYEKPSPILGAPSGEVELTTEILCNSITAASPNPTYYYQSATRDLFEAVFGKPFVDEDYTKNGVVLSVAAATTTTFGLANASALNFTAMGLIAVQKAAGTNGYDIRQIVSVGAADSNGAGSATITVSPPLSSAPANARVVHRVLTYRAQDVGPSTTSTLIDFKNTRPITILVCKNNQYHTYTGCVGNVKFDLTPGGILEATFSFKADDAVNGAAGVDAGAWDGAAGIYHHSLLPPANYAGSSYNRASGALLPATKIGVDVGMKTIEKPAFNGTTARSCWENVGRETKATAQVYNLSNQEMALYTANTAVGLFAQMGDPYNAAGGFALAIDSAVLSECVPSDMSGLEMYDLTFQLADNNTDPLTVSRLVIGYHNIN